VIAKEIGGTANSILHIENWPGFSGTGAELMKTIYKQLENYKIDFFNEEVREILKKEKEFVAKTKNMDFLGKSIIIATGTERKRLNIPGEKEFIGKGISYCVTCDGFFFKNKIVGVIGGGDCAISSALALSEITKEVHVFYRGNEIECEITNFEKIRKKNNVKIHYNAIPIKFNGKEKLESRDVNENGNKKTYFIEGVFIEIGSVPLTDLIKKLKIELDKENQINCR
jgi:thioredoxin reductase (NADPH)